MRTRPTEVENKERYDKFTHCLSNMREFIIRQMYADAIGEPLRGAIENISPIVLFDIEPREALSVLQGKKELKRDKSDGSWKWIDSPDGEPIVGEQKIYRTINILRYKLPSIVAPMVSTHVAIKKEPQSIIKSLEKFTVYYEDSSYSPHGNINGLDPENTATVAYGQIVEFFDRISGLPFLTEQTRQLCNRLKDESDLGLPRTRIQTSLHEIDYSSNVEKNKFTDVFADIRDNTIKGILVLPAEYPDGQSALDFKKLLNIKWSLIIDYNRNTEEGMYSTLPDDRKSLFPEVILQDGKTEYVADGRYRHSWIFADGNNKDYSTLVINPTARDIRKRNQSIVQCIKKTEENNANDFSFFLVFPNASTVSRLIETIYYDPSYSDNFESKFHFFVLAKDDTQKQEWQQIIVQKDFRNNIEIIGLPGLKFLSCVDEVLPKSDELSVAFSLTCDGKTIEIPQSDLYKYYEAGIEFVDTSMRRSGDWDFYDGAEITWAEIQEGKAVRRIVHDSYLENIKVKIKNNRSIVKDQFLYYPGSGATTFLRQIAYDIDKYSRQNQSFQCLPIFIKRHEPAKLLDMLAQLSSIFDGALLVIFDSHVLSEESLNALCDDLDRQEKHGIYFIRITPTINTGFTSIISKQLNNTERAEFNRKYNSLGLLSDDQIIELNKFNQITAIDYPMAFKDAQQIEGYAMKHFADTMLSSLPPEWNMACVIISFVYKYTGKSVSLSLLRQVLSGKDSLNKWTPEVQKSVKRLLVEVDENGHATNMWRPRYRVLGDCLLASHFNVENEKWCTPFNLYQISKQLIEICSSFSTEINNEDEQILQRLFTEKSEDDFRRFEGNEDYLNTFPLVIQDINDYDYIKEIMDELVKVYAENPYFLAHYSRFLYEYTSHQIEVSENDSAFLVAQDLIERATKCNEKSDKVYHMQGTLYNRRIRVFRVRYSRSQDIPSDSINDVKRWMDEAISAFASSELYSPLNSYGYMTEGQTIQQGIESVALCLGDSNYSFCEKDPWTEYVNRLNSIILHLNGLIKSSDSGSEQMFSSLCRFHIKVIGSTEERCKLYYENALNYTRTKAERVRFSQLFYWSTIYKEQERCNVDNRDLYHTFKQISNSDLEKLKNVLTKSLLDDNIQAFKQLHELKLYGDEPYPIEEAIRHWKLCVEKCERLNRADLSFTLMNAYYMLESYYAAKYILAGLNGEAIDDNDKRQYEKYRNNAVDIAHRHDKHGTIHSYFFLGHKNDARVLIPAQSTSDRRRKVECKIVEVGSRSGKAKVLPSGIMATFGACKKTHQDIGETDFWQIGFRYEGIGLYDERDRHVEEYNEADYGTGHSKVENKNNEQLADDAPTVNMVTNNEEKKISNSTIFQAHKVGEIIPLSPNDTNRFLNLAKGSKAYPSENTLTDADVEGVYVLKSNMVILDNGFHYQVKSKLEELYDGADVVFRLENDEKNPKFKRAVNVRIKD